MKLQQVADLHEALNELANAAVPIRVAILFKKNILIIKPANEVFHERRQALFKKHGTEKDGQITIKAKSRDKFNTEINELLDEEIEIILEPFSIDVLLDEQVSKKLEISTNQLLALDPILTDG